MRAWLYHLNAFAHDFFSAFWLASGLVLYLLKERQPCPPAVKLHELLFLFFVLQLASLILIMITGLFRFLGNKQHGGQPDRVRRQLLVIKHLLLTVIYLGGSLLGYLWAFG